MAQLADLNNPYDCEGFKSLAQDDSRKDRRPNVSYQVFQVTEPGAHKGKHLIGQMFDGCTTPVASRFGAFEVVAVYRKGKEIN